MLYGLPLFVEDRYKVRRYRGEVSIALVSVLAITPLAIIYAVIYIYSCIITARGIPNA